MAMEFLRKWRVALGMIIVQVIATGLQILSRVILTRGTFIFALMAYRHVVAAFTIAPFALYLERGGVRNLTFAAFFWLFMVALTGVSMAMGLFYYGLKDTTATYATNFLNLIPVVTFLLSTVLRVEKLGLKTRAGKMKSLGAIVCVAGALSMSLYKGKCLGMSHYHKPKIMIHLKQNKTQGTIFLGSSVLSYAFWFILQVKLLKVFPYKYWATLLICIIASVQATIVGLCIDTNPKSWRLGWDLQLLTIFYSGMLGTAATFCLVSMAIIQEGPTYPSMFNPLALTFIAIIELLLLGEQLSVGSLIGMGLIIVGLYSFLWGKHKDMKGAIPMLDERGGRGSGGSHGGGARAAALGPLGRQSSAKIVSTTPLRIIPLD